MENWTIIFGICISLVLGYGQVNTAEVSARLEPVDPITEEGSDLNLKCYSPADYSQLYSDIRFVIQHNGLNITGPNSPEGYTEDQRSVYTYSKSSVQAKDQGNYTCVIQAGSGNESTVVNAYSYVYVIKPDTSPVTVTVGVDATIDYTSRPELSLQPENELQVERKVNDTFVENKTKYVRDNTSHAIKHVGEARLEPVDPVVEVGSNITFRCSSPANFSLQYDHILFVIRHNGLNITEPNSPDGYSTADHRSLYTYRKTRVQPKDQGNYTCLILARSGNESTVVNAYSYVYVIKPDTGPVIAKVGIDATIECISRSEVSLQLEENIHIEWKLNDTLMKNNTKYVRNNTSLVIKSVDESDMQTAYDCLVATRSAVKYYGSLDNAIQSNAAKTLRHYLQATSSEKREEQNVTVIIIIVVVCVVVIAVIVVFIICIYRRKVCACCAANDQTGEDEPESHALKTPDIAEAKED